MINDEMIKALIKEELKEAELNNGALFKSAHEAYAVTLEEVEELTERINDIHVIQGIIWERNIRKDEYSSYDIYLRLLKAAAEEAIKEAVQVAAMAQKALNTLEAEE